MAVGWGAMSRTQRVARLRVEDWEGGDGVVLRGAERRVRSGALPPRIGSRWGSGAASLSGVNDPFEAAF